MNKRIKDISELLLNNKCPSCGEVIIDHAVSNLETAKYEKFKCSNCNYEAEIRLRNFSELRNKLGSKQ